MCVRSVPFAFDQNSPQSPFRSQQWPRRAPTTASDQRAKTSTLLLSSSHKQLKQNPPNNNPFNMLFGRAPVPHAWAAARQAARSNALEMTVSARPRALISASSTREAWPLTTTQIQVPNARACKLLASDLKTASKTDLDHLVTPAGATANETCKRRYYFICCQQVTGHRTSNSASELFEASDNCPTRFGLASGLPLPAQVGR